MSESAHAQVGEGKEAAAPLRPLPCPFFESQWKLTVELHHVSQQLQADYFPIPGLRSCVLEQPRVIAARRFISQVAARRLELAQHVVREPSRSGGLLRRALGL